ncbi:MAG TPA: hypothetical protein VK446_00215 [Methylocystis sp.]|nr:hypothetical protein [Methylocystis sp.]
MERLLRRGVAMAFGFVLAAGAGAALLPILTLLDPVLRDVGVEAAISAAFAFFDDVGDPEAAAAGFHAFADLLWAATLAVCVAPLALVALIGLAAHQRGWLWHAGGCGFLAAAAPWIARAAHASPRAHAATALELRLAALFFLTGVVTGTVYWLIAARGAREQRG